MKDENIAKREGDAGKRGKTAGFDLYQDLFYLNGWNPSLKRYTFHEMDDPYAAVGCGGCIDHPDIAALIEECQKKHKQERKAELFEKAKQAAHRGKLECQDAFAWRNCKGPRKYVGSYGTLL